MLAESQACQCHILYCRHKASIVPVHTSILLLPRHRAAYTILLAIARPITPVTVLLRTIEEKTKRIVGKGC